MFITARYDGNETALSIVNRSGEVKRVAVSAADFTQGPDTDGLKMPNSMTDALTDRRYESENGTLNIELEQACAVHGIDADKLTKQLNDYLANK